MIRGTPALWHGHKIQGFVPQSAHPDSEFGIFDQPSDNPPAKEVVVHWEPMPIFLAFSLNSELLVIAQPRNDVSDSPTIQIWDLTTMKPRELIEIDPGIKNLSPDPDGTFLRTGVGRLYGSS